nr:ATP-binding protein [Nitrospinaceae bacterium]
MTETTELHHSIDAKHVQNIGEQSVSDRVQAIIEIVKNSYDADALNCTVKFFARSGGSGTLVNIERIEISDDGTGMTLDDIKNKWMRLATDSKVKEFTSKKFGRRVSGQKGMGHFATQKLGSKVTIISNPEFNDADKTFILYTDWSKYISGLSFADIPNKLVTGPRNSEDAKKQHTYGNGVTIEITGLKEDWTKDDVEKVQRHLGALQIPKFLRSTEENVFRAQVESVNFDVENLPDTDITDYAPWTIEARLRGNKINYKISELDYSTKKKILAKPVNNLDSRGTIDVKSQCGDADIHLYFYPGMRGGESGSINDLLRAKGPGGWMPKKIVKDRAHLQNVMKSTA